MSSRRKIAVLSLALLVVLIARQSLPGQDAVLVYRGRTITEWTDRLKNPNLNVRQRAAVCLGEIGPDAKMSVLALVELLKDRNADVSSSAVDALAKIGSASVTALVGVLKDSDESVRNRAVDALVRIGSGSVSALKEAIKDKELVTRRAAAVALGRLGREAREARGTLVTALADQDNIVRLGAIEALANIGVDEEIAPTLVKLFKDYDVSISGAAVNALSSGGSKVVPALIAALKDKSPDLRVQVIDVLARIGEPAKAAVPALLAALKDDCRDVQQGATKALARVGPADVPALIGALKDRHDMTQSVVLGVLYELGPKAKGAETDLGRILTESENASSRVLAARVLGRIGPDAKAALPDLIEGLRDSEVSVRAAAACALGSFGKAARDAVPALIEALTDKNDVLTDHDERVVGRAAGDALKQIDPDAAKKAGVP